jgi:hypothetical protein
MIENHDNRQQAIERLVDGELSIDEERELLASFEEDSSGWKTLAEMFLEDRILAASLGSNAQISRQTPVIAERSDSHSSSRMRNRTVTKFVSIAALVLVAFVSGRHSTTLPEQSGTSRVAQSERKPEETSQPTASERRLPPAIELVTLNVSLEDNISHQIDVPLVPWEQVAASYSAGLETEPEPFVPEEVRKFLARNGRTIDRQISYIPFETLDGRTGVIPVSRIEVRSNRFPEIQ